MQLYTIFSQNSTDYAHSTATDSVWIFFYVVGNGEWLNAGLPMPTLLIPLQHSYYVGYKIEGYFATQKNRKFLQDVITRFIITLAHEGAHKVEYLPYKPYLGDKDIVHYNEGYIYNLRDDIAPNLLSLQESKKRDIERDKLLATIGQYTNSEDELFDAIRFSVYDFVKMNGKDALTLEYVLDIARAKYEIIGSKKGWSTAKAKAKSIYRWVKEHYKVGSKTKKTNRTLKKYLEETMATRKEHIIKVNKQRAIDKKNKVKKAAIELIKQGTELSVRKVAKYAEVSTKTAQKYLKELKEAGEI